MLSVGRAPYCVVLLSSSGKFVESAHKTDIRENRSDDTTTEGVKGQERCHCTLLGLVGVRLCLEQLNHFSECHALSGITPSSTCGSRAQGHPVGGASTLQHGIHSGGNVPVRVGRFPAENLKVHPILLNNATQN